MQKVDNPTPGASVSERTSSSMGTATYVGLAAVGVAVVAGVAMAVNRKGQ